MIKFSKIMEVLYNLDKLANYDYCAGYVTALLDNGLVTIEVYKHFLKILSNEN